MSRKTDIVVTTIFEPSWLSGYLDNLRKYGREQEVTLRIICDRKTPATVFAAADAARGNGFNVDCPTLEEQENYLKKHALGDGFIPWNTDNRRNIGFLRAWEAGTEVLVSIDDDNYCNAESDFVGSHHIVGEYAGNLSETDFADGDWYNICARLHANSKSDFYARGYPYAARNVQEKSRLSAPPKAGEKNIVSVNAGLWTDDPDVDAVTRLALAPRVTDAQSGAVVLGPNTWSPINTQNTALIRAAIPAYYYVRMGFPIQGMTIDRFGDILSGYFLQKCAKHLGHSIRFGDPVAAHRRSPHNLFKDLFHELAGMVIVEDLLPWLRELKLEGSNYTQAYASLAYSLQDQADSFTGFVWDDGGRDFLRETADCMQTWLSALKQISGDENIEI